MKIRSVLPAFLAAVLAAPIVACAQQKYPARSVRLVLPFAAGSAVDVLARLYAQRAAGFEVVGSSPEVFAALIRNDTARLGKVIRDAGIRVE
jgi:tripartite-type tricarboxylate transporter receptor subunit TctC